MTITAGEVVAIGGGVVIVVSLFALFTARFARLLIRGGATWNTARGQLWKETDEHINQRVARADARSLARFRRARPYWCAALAAGAVLVILGALIDSKVL